MPTHIEVVAAERRVLEDDVDEILAPTVLGQIGVLPRHAALLTLLAPGALRLRKGDDEMVVAIGGGFLEVADNHVVVLADSAERADEIDLARAEEARRRAADRLAIKTPDVDVERAQLAMARALARLQAADRVRRRSGRPRQTRDAEQAPGLE